MLRLSASIQSLPSTSMWALTLRGAVVCRFLAFGPKFKKHFVWMVITKWLVI